MRKIVFFIPAILFVAFYGLVAITVRLSISPVVFVWIAAFAASGILLSKGFSWCGCFGLLPGAHMMYMSTIDTGQVLPIEFPLGLLVVAFYALCCIFVWYRKKKAPK